MQIRENLDPEDLPKLRQEVEQKYHLILRAGNIKLFLRQWQHAKTKETAVLIFHGITAHSGPYTMIAEPLTTAGYTVFGLDLRGHGLSDGNRGDYQSSSQLNEDLLASVDYIHQLGFDDIVILGHSLGVLTSLKLIELDPEGIVGLALFSAALEVKEGARPGLTLWSKIKIGISSIIRPSMPVITYYREVMTGMGDPLFMFRYTLRFMKIFDADSIKLPYDLEIPFYMGIGENDELFEVDAAKELFEQIDSDEKIFTVIKGAKHALFPFSAFDDLVKWMTDHFN